MQAFDDRWVDSLMLLHTFALYCYCVLLFSIFSPLACTLIIVAFFSVVLFCIMFSCPVGQRRLGASQCINEDECEHPGLCQNGATCINLSDRRHFQCKCTPQWTGHYCTEPAPAGAILLGGKDFIIVFVFCVASLLSKFCFWIFELIFLMNFCWSMFY